jgi:sulfhydrogenase subunit delta
MTSTPIADHVRVDLELRGCPISKHQLLEVVAAYLTGRKPRTSRRTPSASSASGAGTVCVMVSRGTPCLGPVTQAGCGAICPAYDRGCYGCFGPMETPNTGAIARQWTALGVPRRDVSRAFHGFNANADPFRLEGEAYQNGGE